MRGTKKIQSQPKRQLRPTFIKAWRKYRNLTQEQLLERLAETIPMSSGTLSRLENAKQPYSQEWLEALADALQCQPADLLMRRPGENEIWSLVSSLKPAQARQVERFIRAIHEEDAA